MMEGEEGEQGSDVVPGPWEAFALAEAATLRLFTHVFLAPKIPRAKLNNALLSYVPLKKDELIVALIGRRNRARGSFCALTTHRIYWEEMPDAQPRGSAGANGQAAGRGPLVWIARYRDLPEIIPHSKGPNGSVRLDVGGGRAIVLKGVGDHLGEALARFLQRMSAADRRGSIPPIGEVDPALAAQVSRELPAVAQISAEGRKLVHEIVRFRSDLQSATRRPVATQAFMLACLVLFAVMVASGVSVLSPSPTALRDWGANDGARVVLRGEYWRLITAAFVHGGLIHLAVNMWSLLVIGPLVERLYGNLAFAVVYLAAGVGGAIASVTAAPVRIGVGASGAICGVLGALIAFLIVHRRSIPASLLKSLATNILAIVVFMVILGWIVPNIDQEAHYGGLATGFLSGLLLYRPWPVVRSRWVAIRRFLASGVIAAALLGAAYGMTLRATAIFPPSSRFREIAVQLTPALDELNTISDELPSSLALKRDRNDSDARQRELEKINELGRRSVGNLKLLNRAATPYPALRNMAGALVQAQTSQIAALDAARRYLDSGDPGDLSGPSGLLKMKTACNRALQSFQQQQIQYLRANNLLREPEDTTISGSPNPD
jgi:rhomboid protease GluP